jgi:predicted MPP superfamily phosphohydrolase
VKIWIGLIVFVLIAILMKIYLSKGIFQITDSIHVKNGYLFLSIASLLFGVICMATVFPKGIKDMSTITNFIISFMVSVLICEIILLLFFTFDDLFIYFKNAFVSEEHHKISNDELNSRRTFIKSVGLTLVALPFASFMYGITKGKYNFKLFKHTLFFSDLPKEFDGFKIVQFSDLHSGGFDSYEDVKRGFDLIQNQNADLILFTGDLVNDIAEEINPYKKLLNDLKAPYGKYSILGNHDYSEDDGLFPDEASKLKNSNAIQQYQRDAGFILLNNQNTKIEKQNSFIRLIGVENWGNGFIKKGNLDEAIKDCTAEEFSILMSHDPTHWEKIVKSHPKHIHLTLSGHTHGMQMGIEAFGIKWSPIKYIYKYWAGLYYEMNQYLYVNRGFGFMAFAGRVGITPEITVFTLKLK